MPLFKNNSKNIIELLNEISNPRRQILFGDSPRFRNWFKEQEIDDEVSIFKKYKNF